MMLSSTYVVDGHLRGARILGNSHLKYSAASCVLPYSLLAIFKLLITQSLSTNEVATESGVGRTAAEKLDQGSRMLAKEFQ